MKAVENSLLYRAALRVEAVARCALVGRFLVALGRVLSRLFGGSATFGLRRVGSRRLGRRDHSLSVLAISRPYLWARARLGGGVVGRAVRAVGAGTVHSQFAGGGWAVVVGSGIFALGCGRLVHAGGALAAPQPRLVTPVVLMLIGALMFLAGPKLIPAFRASLIGRGGGRVVGASPGGGVAIGGGATGPEPDAPALSWGRLAGFLGAGVVLALAGGVVAGLTPDFGAVAVVALVAAAGVFALMLWRPEVVLLAAAAFPWLDWAARHTLGGIGPAWDDAFLILSIVLLLWCVIVLRRWELWTVPIALPTLLALVAAVGSVAVRDVPGDVALFALRVLFQPLLFYFLGFLFPKNKRWVQWTVAVFVLAGVALALHGLYQYVTHAPMPARWVDVRETEIGTRAYSVIENPNGLGAFLLMGALVTLSLALARGVRGLQRVAMAAACIVQLGGVAVTFSRGAWLGLGAGILALLVMAHRRYLAPLVAAGVVGWFVMPQAFTNRLTFAFSSAYIVKSSAAGRLYVWKLSLQHVVAHPWFGVGLGTFGGTSAVTFGYGRLWVDNFYLQLGAEGGVLLLAFFLWILWRGAKGLVRGHGATRDPYLRALAAGVFGAFIAVAVANVTASVWETLVVGAGFWFLAGLATSATLHEGAAASGLSRADRGRDT